MPTLAVVTPDADLCQHLLSELRYRGHVVEQQQALEELAVFAEPQRRRVFEQVRAAGTTTVNDLAAALGIGRSLVVFHLGKLVDAGFVEVTADQGRRRPGRPAVKYRATAREVAASVPDRRYDLLAGVLLDSVADHRPGESAHASALRAARRRGAELGRRLRTGRAPRTRAARLARLEALLASLGYAPRRGADEVVVLNCPFDRFRATNTPQVCSLNQSLSDGYLDGLELDDHLCTELRPSPETCCVVFRERSGAATG